MFKVPNVLFHVHMVFGGGAITLDVNVTHGKMEASMNAVHHSLDFCKCRLYQTQREKLLLI